MLARIAEFHVSNVRFLSAPPYSYNSETYDTIDLHDVTINGYQNEYGTIKISNSAGQTCSKIYRICAYDIKANYAAFLFCDTFIDFINLTSIVRPHDNNYISSIKPGRDSIVTHYNSSSGQKIGGFISQQNTKFIYCNFDSSATKSFDLSVTNGNIDTCNFINSQTVSVRSEYSSISNSFFVNKSDSVNYYIYNNAQSQISVSNCCFDLYSATGSGSISLSNCITKGKGDPTNFDLYGSNENCKVNSYQTNTWTQDAPEMTPVRTWPDDCILNDDAKKKQKKRVTKIYSFASGLLSSF